MTTVQEIESYLFRLAPRELMQSWDNVGLLVGDGHREVGKILVALDITAQVIEEAAAEGADLIVAHHPLINCAWHPLQAIRTGDPQGELVLSLIQKRISAICMHTNLDAAVGGVNDVLAETLGLQRIAPLSEDGLGRIGVLPQPQTLEDFAAFLKECLGANGIRYADGGRLVHQVAVGGGACGEFAQLAASLGCDTFVTADLKYHDFQNAAGLKLNLIDAGHFPTEDVVCGMLVEALHREFPTITVQKSKIHHEIIQYYV